MGFKNTALNLLFNPIGIAEETIGRGTGAGKFSNKGDSSGNSPIPLPQPPSAEKAADKAQENVNKRRVAQSQTVYTSPLGVSGQANVSRAALKEKLGQ